MLTSASETNSFSESDPRSVLHHIESEFPARSSSERARTLADRIKAVVIELTELAQGKLTHTLEHLVDPSEISAPVLQDRKVTFRRTLEFNYGDYRWQVQAYRWNETQLLLSDDPLKRYLTDPRSVAHALERARWRGGRAVRIKNHAIIALVVLSYVAMLAALISAVQFHRSQPDLELVFVAVPVFCWLLWSALERDLRHQLERLQASQDRDSP